MWREGERERGREGERERGREGEIRKERFREGGRRKRAILGRAWLLFLCHFMLGGCVRCLPVSPSAREKCKAQRAATGRIQGGQEADLDMGSRRCGLFGTEGTGRAVHTPVRLLLHDFAHDFSGM
jgi:hypothetical protein